jgi:hypothetical protein
MPRKSKPAKPQVIYAVRSRTGVILDMYRTKFKATERKKGLGLGCRVVKFVEVQDG